MTPVHIREPREADYVEVAFLESAAFTGFLRETQSTTRL